MSRKYLFSLLLLLAFMLASCTLAAPAATPTVAAPPAAPTATNPPEPTAVPTTVPISAPTATTAAAEKAGGELILATTTSTRDSGLLDVLLPVFEKQCGCTVKMVAVGSGQALQMGQEGNADVLLVHSPTAENDFMSKEFGKERLLVMHNDFLIVGPPSDPAGIKGEKTAAAFKKIAERKATFISRGDKSGTNTAELAIWKKAEITPTKDDKWYLSTGGAMGDTLNVTSEKEGYTLIDRATYLALKDKLSLDIMVEGEADLLNIYHVITVNPEKWPKVNAKLAKDFANFMVSAGTQKLIGSFGVDKYGQQLFIPDAGKDEDKLGK